MRKPRRSSEVIELDELEQDPIEPNGQSPTRTADEMLADVLLQKDAEKKERVERCAKVIEEVCQKERVTLIVSSFNIMDGRIAPVIQLVAMD
jgi:hypothetical protein